ncbi:MAG: radical SAM protein [Bradyrhizobium sp.]
MQPSSDNLGPGAVFRFTIDERNFVYSARQDKLFEEVGSAEGHEDGNCPIWTGEDSPGLQFPPPALTLRLRTIEFVITGACNLDCTYCATRDRYKLPNGRNDRLMQKTAIAALGLLRPHMDKAGITLKFFGGEPLLGMNVIEKIIEQVETWRVQSKNVVATNGLLLSDGTVDFLVEHRFLTFISLDGPPKIHDANRVDHRGRGSYEKVLEKIMRFKQRYPREFASNVIINMVVTPQFAGRFQEQVDHLLALGIRKTQINPNECVPTSSRATWYTPREWEDMQDEKARTRSRLIAQSELDSSHDSQDCFQIYAGLNVTRKTGSNATDIEREEGGTLCADCQSDEWSTVTVLPDGGITSCIEFNRSASVEFGNVKAGKLDLDAFAAFQQAFRKSVREGPCANCWAIHACRMVECYKAFATAGANLRWQRTEDCDTIREELAPRFRDAVKLYLLRKEVTI